MHLVKFILENYRDKLDGLFTIADQVPFSDLLIGLSLSGATDQEKGAWFAKLVTSFDPKGLIATSMFDVDVSRKPSGLFSVSLDFNEFYPIQLSAYSFIISGDVCEDDFFDLHDETGITAWVETTPEGASPTDVVHVDIDINRPLKEQLLPHIQRDSQTIFEFARDRYYRFSEALAVCQRSGVTFWRVDA